MEPFSMQDLLGLGIPLEPEQAWLHDQVQGHAMALWTPPDPRHELDCTEGCGFPILLENDEPLIIPTPVRFDASAFWIEDEAEEGLPDNWREWPTVLCKVDGLWNNICEWQPYRIWDLWPITSTEHKALRSQQHNMFDQMGMYDYTLLAEMDLGDYSVWDEMESRGLFDGLEAQETDGREDEWEAQAHKMAEEFIEDLATQVGDTQMREWSTQRAEHHLGLYDIGLGESWHRLRSTSLSAWRTVARCYRPAERSTAMYSQKWINPWP